MNHDDIQRAAREDSFARIIASDDPLPGEKWTPSTWTDRGMNARKSVELLAKYDDTFDFEKFCELRRMYLDERAQKAKEKSAKVLHAARQITDLRDAEANMYDNHRDLRPLGVIFIGCLAFWAGVIATVIWAYT
jgi:hypothetical protein